MNNSIKLVLVLLISSYANAYYNFEVITHNGFNNPKNTEITALLAWNDHILAATHNQEEGAKLYISPPHALPGEWQLAFEFPKEHVAITHLALFKGNIVAGTLDYTIKPYRQSPTSLWIADQPGSFTKVIDNGFGDSKNAVVRALLATKDRLFIGTSHTYSAKVYASEDALLFEKLESAGFGVPYLTHVFDFVWHAQSLYASTSMGRIFKLNPLTDRFEPFSSNFGFSSQELQTGEVKSLASYHGQLIAGAHHKGKGGSVWAYSEADKKWIQASKWGIDGDPWNHNINVWYNFTHPETKQQYLVGGTWSRKGASIFLTSSTKPPFDWQQIGKGGFNFYSQSPNVRDIVSLGNELFISLSGESPYGTSLGGKLIKVPIH